MIIMFGNQIINLDKVTNIEMKLKEHQIVVHLDNSSKDISLVYRYSDEEATRESFNDLYEIIRSTWMETNEGIEEE